MSTPDDSARGAAETVSLALELAHAPAKVWRALTQPELLSRWLLPVVGLGELAPGARFRFEPAPQPGWDGVVSCRLLEIEAPHKLSWAWVAGDIDTVLTFTLTPTDAGTHLAIEQTGFAATQKQAAGGARYGWKMMSGRLLDLLAEIE